MTKTTLIKKLKQKGIPIPKNATVAELEHRLKYWIDGNGYMFRLALPSSRVGKGHPVQLLESGSIYWIPNSDFAHKIANTKLVYLMGRSLVPPKECVVLDVPKDFNDKWCVGDTNGGHN